MNVIIMHSLRKVCWWSAA